MSLPELALAMKYTHAHIYYHVTDMYKYHVTTVPCRPTSNKHPIYSPDNHVPRLIVNRIYFQTDESQYAHTAQSYTKAYQHTLDARSKVCGLSRGRLAG